MRRRRLTAAIHKRQLTNEPVHRWTDIDTTKQEDWRASYTTIGAFMSTDLFTVRPDDLVDLAASVMNWRHVRHVPVEDDAGCLIGIVSHRTLLQLFTAKRCAGADEPVAVRNIMKLNPITVSPATGTLEAIELMRRHRVGCLPVIENGRLVGIVTERDFLSVCAKLFEMHLTETSEEMKV
jgi:CBS domain-containing protein